MATKKRVGRPAKKGPAQKRSKAKGKKPNRHRYSLKTKLKAIELKESGLTLKQIMKWFIENEQLHIQRSTICTWYAPKMRQQLKELGELWPLNNDTCLNTKQRPRIIMDVEQILRVHVQRSQENGFPLTLQAASIAALQIYERLKMLAIYDQNGQRSVNTDVLSEHYINYILNQHERNQEITDINDPHYEDPDTTETNEVLINSVTVWAQCLLCYKKVYSNAVFSKHLLSHTNDNVAAVAATMTGVTAAAAARQNENNPDEPSDVDDYSNFDINQFKASIGWIQKFLRRQKLGSYILKGEKGSNDSEAAEAFAKEFTAFLAREAWITVNNVLTIVINFDEAGIQYKSIPTRGIIDIKLEIKAKKPIKSRFTCMFGTTASGHKFKPLVIGKSNNPRCFSNIRKEDLPCYYYCSDSAWMTQDIFYDWFTNGFQQEVNALYGHDQQIYVLLDNCRAHPPQDMLDSLYPNIMVWMLPPNTTALIQPMDMGVIYSVKARAKKYYYNQMVEYSLTENAEDPVVDFMKSYTILDALYDVDKAWKSIEPELIQKCYENVIDQKLFLANQEESFRRKQSWEGLNFKGFEDSNAVTAMNKKKQELLKRNRKTLGELAAVDVEQVASDINSFLKFVSDQRPNQTLQTVTAEAVLEDIEFDPYFSTTFDDEIVEVLTGIEPTLDNELEHDIVEENNVSTSSGHPFIECFKHFNAFKLHADPMTSTFSLTDKSRFRQITTELSEMISGYMDLTKTPRNVDTEDMRPSTSGETTYFRPAPKNAPKLTWKREIDDGGSDSEESITATEKLTSDHSSDNIVSDVDDCVEPDSTLELCVPDQDCDSLYE